MRKNDNSSVKEHLNILVLHRMGDPRFWRTAVRDLEFMLPTYAPEHNYIVHDGNMTLPDFIKEIKFHSIVLGPTFLCDRYRPAELERTLKEYDFIRTADSFKIALPQDDYDCSGILDRWMVSWNVDVVYTVCPDNWSILYPNYSEKGKIQLGYTGYVSDACLKSCQHPKPFHLRSIDVSYRANKLPPNFGKIGYIKGVIGGRFISKFGGMRLNLDISTDQNDLIPGDRWHAFLEDSKFCLVTNSGSSLLDPEGEIRARVNRYLSINPRASFEVVEENCFKGEDGKYIFTAISPRNIEAALARTVQIGTIGNYSGILRAEDHYIPLEPDCSNVSDVVSIMNDHRKTATIAKNCKDAILSVDDLRFKNHVSKLIQQIDDGVSAKKIYGSSEESVKQAISQYRNEANVFWRRRRVVKKLRSIGASFGGRYVRDFLFGPKL